MASELVAAFWGHHRFGTKAHLNAIVLLISDSLLEKCNPTSPDERNDRLKSLPAFRKEVAAIGRQGRPCGIGFTITDLIGQTTKPICHGAPLANALKNTSGGSRGFHVVDDSYHRLNVSTVIGDSAKPIHHLFYRSLPWPRRRGFLC